MNVEKFIPVLFLVLFPLFWIGICIVCSHMGGWARLARQFRDDGHHAAKAIRTAWMRTGKFGMMNYGSCLNIGIYEEGLRLSVLLPFRAGHPPLLIPWTELANAREKRFLFFRTLEIQVGEPETVTVVLPIWVRDYISAED